MLIYYQYKTILNIRKRVVFVNIYLNKFPIQETIVVKPVVTVLIISVIRLTKLVSVLQKFPEQL